MRLRRAPPAPFILASALVIFYTGAALAGPGLIAELEATLGRQLDEESRAALLRSQRKAREDVKIIQANFIVDLAELSGVSVEQLQPRLPRMRALPERIGDQIRPVLQREMGRPLTDDEISRLRQADDARKIALEPVLERFSEAIAASGISRQAAQGIARNNI